VVRHADVVITPSEYARRMVSGWTRHADRVRVVYGGSRFEDEAPPPPALAREEVVVVTAGRLVSWKGIASLIELVAEHPGWTLVVVGGGPQAAELDARARRLNASVRFTGALPRAELSRQVRRATVFALNTSFENFPHMLLEAMYGGVPVVATRIGGIPELIEDGKEGILVRPDDKRELGAAISRLVSDRGLRDVIVANARIKARRFSVDRMVDGVMEVCREALDRRRGALTAAVPPDGRPSAPR
jgi:glycosyltransferase involved in cell wall biosynthesis